MIARRFLAVLTPALALAIAVMPSSAYAADTPGKEGSIDSLEVNTPSADVYLQYHGRLVLAVTSSTKEEYRWGGTSCGSKTLSDENVRALAGAVRDGLKVTPTYQAGQGSARCLVGFSLRAGK